MSSVTRLDGAQLAGLAAVFFAPVAALPRLPDLDADGLQLLGDLVLTLGTDWAQLQGTSYTPALDVEAAPTAHGPGYEHELAGFFAGDQAAVAAQFRKMQGRRFVLLYRDYAGVVRLVGDPRGGLEFSYKLSTGTKPGERKGYAWRFKGRTAGPALFYTGTMPAAADGPGPAGTGSVTLETAGGQVLARVPAGGRIILKSGFKLSYEIQ